MKLKKMVPSLMILFLFNQYGCKKDCVKNSNCDLKPDIGNCEASIPKYYFNKEEGKCKEFNWGGCGGTVPFDTLEECKACKCNK